MYKTLCSMYYGKVGGKRLNIKIVPEFGCDFFKEERQKVYWYSEKEGLRESFKENQIFLISETEWMICVDDTEFYEVFVKERSLIIQTPFGLEFDGVLNYKIEEVQKKYKKSKWEEKRLYFYNASDHLLSLYDNGTSNFNSSLTRNSVSQVIGREYPIPTESCFLLGRVRKTIVIKRGKRKGELLDFIQPIVQFELDYDKEWDVFNEEKNKLGNKLYFMLKFSIQEEELGRVEKLRIQNKKPLLAKKFAEEVKVALEAGDVGRVKEFYDVVFEPQECSGQKFLLLKNCYAVGNELAEDEEIWASADEKLDIRYENGEEECQKASWIYENISRCTNKNATYFKNRGYNFY